MRKHAEGSEELSARRRRRDEQRMDSEEMEDELRYIKGIEDSWLVDPELISCDQQSKAYFLSVFGGKCTSDNCEWPTITEDKQIISLDYIPLGIYTVCKKNEDIILVSGNDKTVHCYKQDATSKQYNEVQLDQVFPELCFLKDKIILTMDFHFNTDTDYSIAIGCQDGTVLVMTTKTETVVSHILFDGPISSIQFFESLYKSKKILNIALGGAIGCAFVLRDVVECGTSNPILLPKSDTFESVLAVSIHNPDNLFDTEILIGTFGKMIIAYKEEATKPGEYKVNWNLPVAHPIFGLLCGDFLGCFNSDLVACTIFGLHYFKNKQ
uniref:Uncharacterized protein n=1 Tax=Arcella intermedia TaxID=1963864 RepID=A0A6B2L939_9EUKA